MENKISREMQILFEFKYYSIKQKKWLTEFNCCCGDDNKIKMVRKPGNKQKENPVGCTGEDKQT